MIRSLLAIKLSRLQLVAVTAVSIAATVVIIADATGNSGLQTEVLAALHRRIVVHHPPKPAPAVKPVTTTAHTSHHSHASSPAPSPAPAPAPAPSAPSTPASTPTNPPTSTPTTPPPPKPSKVKHVFVIALSTPSYEAAFGHGSVASYLDTTLRKRGTLLSGYETLGPDELPDYLAMVSGEAPNHDTRTACQTYSDFPTSAKLKSDGQISGDGCVYPDTVLTIGDQASSAGLSWKAYIQDQGKFPCVHANDGALDNAPLTGAGPDYDTRHNPFIYFHSLLDAGDCPTDDLDLSKLTGALSAPAKTPSYTFISPGACEDSTPPSTCPTTAPTGLSAEDAFLKQWVPQILSSSAYKQSGALIIIFSASGAPPALKGPVQTGALVLSPFATAGKTVSNTFTPYSVLRSIEEIFAFKPLGAAAGAKSFVSAALPAA